MIYADTSILVPYYVPEALSDRVQQFLRQTPDVALSDLGEVEFFSALARKVRERGLTREDAHRVTALFIGHLDGGAYARLELERAAYHMAQNWLGTFDISLRTVDALHLAVAATNAIGIATADMTLVRAGRSLGLTVHYLGQAGKTAQATV
ncbi:MAG TPA: type II toxin-antitoxin system VapC family toxin [bacterium]|nr:type II toxin-antitoxin system VapC family toxin [bacterium]